MTDQNTTATAAAPETITPRDGLISTPVMLGGLATVGVIVFVLLAFAKGRSYTRTDRSH